MEDKRKIKYLEDTLYDSWVFHDAVEATKQQYGLTEEQALSLLHNVLKSYQCSVADQWLDNWRSLVKKKNPVCEGKENVPPQDIVPASQVNNIGCIKKSNVNFNNNTRNQSTSSKRKASTCLKKNTKKRSGQKKNEGIEEDEILEDESEEDEGVETDTENHQRQPESVWEYFKRMLDLGRDDKTYHKYSAIRNGVIICGDGILAQKNIDVEKYQELRGHFLNTATSIAFSTSFKTYLSTVLTSGDVKSFESAVRSVAANADEELFYLQDVCFAVLKLIKNTPDVRAEEKNFVDFFITPLMIAILNLMGIPYNYESREAFLKSINNIWKNNGTIRSNSEGYKADGIVRHGDLEIMLVEACGAYGNRALSKIQFDRHKGLYACLAMLRTIAIKYKYANINTFEKLNILFLHSKDCFLQLWSINYINNIFVFNRLEKCELSLKFEFKSQSIANCLKFADKIKGHLETTMNIINCLSAEHTEAINNDMLGISYLNEENLESIVRPETHKIKDDTGLCYEDPVSC